MQLFTTLKEIPTLKTDFCAAEDLGEELTRCNAMLCVSVLTEPHLLGLRVWGSFSPPTTSFLPPFSIMRELLFFCGIRACLLIL